MVFCPVSTVLEKNVAFKLCNFYYVLLHKVMVLKQGICAAQSTGKVIRVQRENVKRVNQIELSEGVGCI
jgi:hypothetical protein